MIACTATLHVTMRPGRGALVRAISLIERRGFSIHRLTCEGSRLRCDVVGAFAAVTLLRHLQKLEDVANAWLVDRG